MAIVNHVKKYREEKEISQEDLGQAVGVSRQTIYAIEKGNYNPTLELSFKLAIFFDKTIEELFSYRGEAR
ncbi:MULTISPECIES: helix-turn-helix transcriptional regulator [unclassified Listeria]|uniref:helix-turn-helix transcriptional regulator n=1 Tax=unclassified Listeria TaxID=2642072 RepID=UPI000B5978AF|nr:MULTISPECIES: helix-turn-helix transcriptional regulator [unclassified Listeria]